MAAKMVKKLFSKSKISDVVIFAGMATNVIVIVAILYYFVF